MIGVITIVNFLYHFSNSKTKKAPHFAQVKPCIVNYKLHIRRFSAASAVLIKLYPDVDYLFYPLEKSIAPRYLFIAEFVEFPGQSVILTPDVADVYHIAITHLAYLLTTVSYHSVERQKVSRYQGK